MEVYYLAPPLLLVGTLIGYYVRPYLKVKAENLATREDMEQLLAQTAALTQTTKRIEAEISGDLWSRQKRWEMKSDVLSQALREVSRLEAALLDLDAAFSHPHTAEERSRSANEWDAASTRFDTALVLARIVCTDVGLAFLQAGQEIKETAVKTFQGETKAFTQGLQNRMMEQQKVLNAVRKELGFE